MQNAKCKIIRFSLVLFGSRSLSGGGDDGIRTHDPLLAGQVLSQLSYTPIYVAFGNDICFADDITWWWYPYGWYPRFRSGYLTTSTMGFCFFSKRSFKIEQRIKLLRQNRHFMSHTHCNVWTILHRKEVIQPHLPIRLPCYDLTPIIEPTFDSCPLAVRLRTSGVPYSHGVTGGVYKARERIHRGMLIRDY